MYFQLKKKKAKKHTLGTYADAIISLAMTQGNDQEQLLQDASTLLMFASAAARQRSPPDTPRETDPSTTAPEPSYTRPLTQITSEEMVSRTQKPEEINRPMPGVVSESPPSQPGHNPAHLPAVGHSSIYPPQGYTSMGSSTLPPPQRPSQPVLPHLQPLMMGGRSPGSIDSRLSGHTAYNYPSQRPPAAHTGLPVLPPTSTHVPAHTSALNSPHSVTNIPQHSGYSYYGLDPAFSRMYPPGYSMPNATHSALPQRRQSIAQSPNRSEDTTQKHHFRKTQSASPQETGSGAISERAPAPPQPSSSSSSSRLVPLSPKPPIIAKSPQTENRPRNFEPSVPEHNLPARGSFPIAHKRSPSETSQKRPVVTSPIVSPSLSAVPFARGINVESGKRSSDNAMIAAAALAAAADIPFPLKNKESQHSGVLAETAAKQIGLDSAMKIKHVENPPINDDSVVTEPEDDENKTEDEPVSSAQESVGTSESPSMSYKVSGLVTNVTTQPAKPELKSEPKANEKSEISTPLQLSPEEKHTTQPHTEEKNSGPKEESKSPTQGKLQDENEAVLSVVAPTIVEPKSSTSAVLPHPPLLSSYKVDPDAGTIGCICGIEEDDGFTIQCDVCFRWQHCSCMGYLTNEEVPEDEYKCYYCDEMKWNKIDSEKCREATIARLDTDKYNAPPEKPLPPKRKTSSSGSDDKKRRKSEKEVKPPIEKPSTEKRKSSSAASPNSKAVVAIEINNKDNPLLEDGVTAEQYQGVYYRLEDNDYKTPAVKNLIREIGARLEKSGKNSPAIETMTLNQYRQLKFSKVSLPNHQKYLQERNEIRRSKGLNKTIIKVKAYSENPKQKFVSVTKVGLFITEKSDLSASECVIPAGTVVIEYLGEVDLWKSHVENKTNQYCVWGTVKPKVAKVRLGSLESEGIDLVLDSRFVGNEARFIRKSCVTTANCEIRPVYIPQLHTFKFLVVTTQPITLKGDKLEEELRLPWEWDPLHPINQMIRPNQEGGYEEGKKFEDFSEEERAYLISCVDTILNFVECACNTSNINNQCAIFKIKKATSYLLRSNRKASSLGGGSINKSKEELVLPKKIKEYISWKQRLIDRDQRILERSEFATGKLALEKDKIPDTEAPGVQATDSGATDSSNAKETDVVDEVKKDIDASKIPGELPQKVLAIPLTTEVLVKIKSQVNDAFKPLQRIPSNVNVLADIKDVKLENTSEDSVVGRSEAQPIVKETPVVKEIENKPVVVKKFSFADYKKKMK
ncbi:hypothetical protein JCM33374_g1755 [Metschnikowia sp. JCM 33374]|nr:hypothetical protein JCM33374_g1755 [Metschnikowia sp. JCM 33374]